MNRFIKQFTASILLIASVAGLAAAPAAKPLPTALVIGDSICVSGYSTVLKELLKDQVDVKIGAALSSKITLSGIDRTLNTLLGDGKADVIHFNCGLWDMCIISYDSATGNFYDDTLKGQRMVDPATYERNLRELVRILKGRTDKLIWGTITPIPDTPGRHKGDEYLYNKIAEVVMKENGVMIDDLYSYALPHVAEYMSPNDVHFVGDKGGHLFLAKRIADTIQKALRGELKPEAFRVNPDKPYTIVERQKMTTYTPGIARSEIKPVPQQRGLYASHEMVGKSLLVNSTTGWRWKVTAYDHYVLRMQIVRAGNDFPADNPMPVVERLGQVSDLIVEDQGKELSVRTWATDGIPLKINKGNMGIQWLWTKGLLQDGSGATYEDTLATWEFQMQKDEQFFSLADGEDLTGQAIKCQYDKNVPSKVPGFGSSRNFGMLLNVNKPLGLTLGKSNLFKISYSYADQPMDLFVIIGQNKEEIMKRHAALMGN